MYGFDVSCFTEDPDTGNMVVMLFDTGQEAQDEIDSEPEDPDNNWKIGKGTLDQENNRIISDDGKFYNYLQP